MLELRINDKVIRKCRASGMYPDTLASSLLVLFSIREGLGELIKGMDDSSYSKRAALLYYDLERKGMIQKGAPEESPSIYKLTDKGQVFLEEMEILCPKQAEEAPVVDTENIESWIDDFMELWPKGVKSGSKLVRSDRKSCLVKLKKFMKENPDIDKETILQVTKDYTSDMEGDTTYKLAAIYYISHKDKGSELGALCEAYKEGGGEGNRTEEFIYNNGLI